MAQASIHAVHTVFEVGNTPTVTPLLLKKISSWKFGNELGSCSFYPEILPWSEPLLSFSSQLQVRLCSKLNPALKAKYELVQTANKIFLSAEARWILWPAVLSSGLLPALIREVSLEWGRAGLHFYLFVSLLKSLVHFLFMATWQEPQWWSQTPKHLCSFQLQVDGPWKFGKLTLRASTPHSNSTPGSASPSRTLPEPGSPEIYTPSSPCLMCLL